MILKHISILNYKNLEQVELAFSPKLNTFFGQNGMGKTNLLDAVYFLSFCKSAGNPIDSQNIRHDADFFVIQGFYEASDGTPEEIYNEPHTVFVADFIGESNIYTGHMCGIREVDFCGAKFACLDDLPVGAKVDVIVRPEDVIMTAPEDGTITGMVQSVIFKGMHYEIIVESGDNEVVIQSTRSAKEGDTIGMCLEPDGIHVILADTNQNIFEGELTKHYTVEFAGGEYACDVTQLYAGSSINGDGVLVDAEGQEIETADVKVKVKVPVESIDMSDDTENGDGVCGHIISLIYKGDHYHYVVRTKDDYDFHLHDEYLWNENDYVRLIIPKESIEMSLLGEN